jgi:BolA family transcriptional regulator, general stress-responsive regulator
MNEETYRARMARKLDKAFTPSLLEIKDDSASHAGHAGQHPQGESHFSIKIVSPAFANMSHVARHREIYRVLAEEIKERVHALSLQVLTPDEYTHR